MTEQTLNKPINLENLSLALAKVKSDYLSRIQQIQQAFSSISQMEIVLIIGSNNEYFAYYYGDKYSSVHDLVSAVADNAGVSVCVYYNGRYYFLDNCTIDDQYGVAMDVSFSAYYPDAPTVDSETNTFTRLCHSQFVYDLQNLEWSLNEYWLEAGSGGSPEVFVGSTTPEGYTVYFDPEDSIPSGEGADF